MAGTDAESRPEPSAADASAGPPGAGGQYRLPEDQELFRRTVREFAEREIRPDAQRYDQEERYPAENVAKMAELGLMGITVPERYGGAGLGTMEYALAMEEISRACAAHSVVLSVNVSLVCEPILRYGDEHQQERYLPALASGAYVGAFCLSEPSSGSDVARMATRAVREGDHYVLSGTKNFITNGGVAGLYLVFAATDPSLGSRGVSAFLVEADTPGLRAGPPERKLGIRASSTTQMFFEHCRVPAANRLGADGEGFRIAMSTLDGGRIGIAAQAVGIAQGALDLAIQFVRERQAFGQSVVDFQGVRWMLADMHTRTEAARLLAYRAASLKDEHAEYGEAASMAKLFASETAMWVATKALQLHGGYGYMRESPVEKFFRDAKITEIYEGTSEIQRMVIARHLLG